MVSAASARTLAFGLISVLPLSAQPPAPVFRAGTKLVEVTVTVLDKKGKAVQDLAPSDFTLLDGNKPRPISVFRFDGEAAGVQTVIEPRRLEPGVFTNRVELTGGPPRNITALVLDALNTPPQDNMFVRAQMVRYLKALSPETRVAIFQMGSQLRILHDFTDDGAALRAKLEKSLIGMPLESVSDFNRSVVEAEQFVDMFAGDPQMQAAMEELMRSQLENEMMANAMARRSRMERTLAAMEALGQHLSGIPGRKNLVWISAGISMVSITGSMGMGPRGSIDSYEEAVRRTSQRLAQQGVALYIVDSKGVEVQQELTASNRAPPPVRGRGRFEPQADAERISNDPFPAMELMASITGGRYLHNTNDLAVGFKQAVADLQGSYTLGFYAPEEPDNKWHKLKVRVSRSGLTVRHREGYLADAATPQPVEWSDEKWRAVVTSPVGSSVIPLTARCETTADSELVLTLTIDVNSLFFRLDGDSQKADLRIAIVDRTADGRAWPSDSTFAVSLPAAKWQDARTRGITTSRKWKPVPGATTVRAVVCDLHTGQYGTVDVSLAKLPAVAQ